MTFVNKCLSKERRRRKGRRGERKEEGRKEARKREGGILAQIPFVKNLGNQEPQEAIKQNIPLYPLYNKEKYRHIKKKIGIWNLIFLSKKGNRKLQTIPTQLTDRFWILWCFQLCLSI